MSKRKLLIFLFIFKFVTLSAQDNKEKEYVKRDTLYPEIAERLRLYTDSTFEYFRRASFVEMQATGKWKLNQDTIILNSAGEKMEVVEAYLPSLKKGISHFDVSYFDGREFNYTLIIKLKRGEKAYTDRYGKAYLPSDGAKAFFIQGLIKYPQYVPIQKKSNSFRIKVNPQRVFTNEKWLISSKGICPIGLDGEYARYVLELR